MKKIVQFLIVLTVLTGAKTVAQVGIGTTDPHASAMLDVVSTTKGFLAPRHTTTTRDAIVTPANGLIVFNTTTNQLEVNTGTTTAPIWSALGKAYTAGASLVLSGTEFQRAALTGDVTADANSNATTIASGSVTTAKLADDAVTNVKIGEVISIKNGGTGTDMTTTVGYVKQASLGANFTTVTTIPVADVTGAQTTANLASNITANTGSTTLYPSVAAVETFVTNAATPDATATVKGKIKLANHLGGTADAPTVPGLATKQDALTLTTTGTGAASLLGATLNIPTPNNGTVTNVAALTLGTSGTDIASTVATATTTPVITLNVPTASAANRGALSAADWTTFNDKIGGTGTINYVPKFSATKTLTNSSIFDNGTNVGIGTASPANTLEIKQGTAGNSGLRFTNLNSSSTATTSASKVLGLNSTGDVILTNVPGTQNIVAFSTTNPNSGSPTFTPAQPTDQSVIYQSSVDNSMWTYNGTTYVTYSPPAATAWNLANTTNDAGSNKTSGIWRNGSIGIGTNNPTTNLDVVGGFSLRNTSGAAGSNYAMEFNTNANSPRIDWVYNGSYTGSFAGDADFFFRLQNSKLGSGGFRFMTNPSGTAVERMTILNNGNIGIGTTAPSTKLHIQGIQATLGANASATMLRMSRPTWAGFKWGSAAQFNLGTYDDGVSPVNSKARLDLALTNTDETTLTTTMTWLANGNVGINNTAPSAPLVVQGVTGTGALKLIAPSVASGDNWWLGFGHGTTSTDANDRARIGTDIVSGGAGRLFFTTGAPGAQTRAMFIDESQRVGIGTSAPLTLFTNAASGTNFVSSNNSTQGTTGISWLTNSNGFNTSLYNSNNGVGSNGLQVKVANNSSLTLAFEVGQNTTQYGTSAPLFDVLGNGNVGIGTSTPASKLEVSTGVTTTNSIVNATGSIDDFLQYNIQNTSTGTKAQSGFNAMANNGNDTTGFVWMGINNSNFNYPTIYNIGGPNDVAFIGSGQDMYVANANNTKSIIFSTGKATTPYFGEQMRILNNGNVGVGTATPLNKLAVKGLNNPVSALGTAQTNATFRVDGDTNHALDMGTILAAPYGSYIQSHNKASVTSLPLNLNPVGGNVGIGTLNPGSTLEVNGSATNTVAYNSGSATAILFNNSNLAYTSASPTAFNLQGIKNGGTYTLAVQGTTSGTSSFFAAGFTFKSVNNGTTIAGKDTLYTFVVMGTTVYVYMATGFN